MLVRDLTVGYSSILRNKSNYLRNCMTIGSWWTVRGSNREKGNIFLFSKTVQMLSVTNPVSY